MRKDISFVGDITPTDQEMVASEAKIQQACFTWFWNEYPEHRRKLFHISNEGKKGGLQNGIVSGVPDLFLTVPRGEYHGLFIEMKKPTGRLSKDQKKVIEIYSSEGFKVIIVDCLELFQYLVIKYLQNA